VFPSFRHSYKRGMLVRANQPADPVPALGYLDSVLSCQ
jgi:hypothetical protein